MPFEKYLGPQDGQSHVSNSNSYTTSTGTSYTSSNVVHDDHVASAFSNPVQLQIPQFIYGGPPMLAPGGGAEVLPAASLNNSWFANNGFTPRFSNEGLFHGHSQSISPDNGQRRSIAADSLAPASRTARVPPFDYAPPHTLRTELPTTAPLLYSPLDIPAVCSKSLQPNTTQYPPPTNALSLAAPSSLGLPVYSSSGFDLLSILARVVNRPNPRISLGPVDLTCSFVVVDVRRHDNPIIFCSPTFCALTGYDESEVVGRNCRFLQAPNGAVTKGEQRRFTSSDAVSYMRKSLAADKECQTSIVNYRKNGTAFINLVTVIPIPGGEQGLPHEEHEVYYHVGFQVDLNEQPNAILDKLRDGSYMVNYAAGGAPQLPYPTRERKGHTPPQPVMSKSLKALLADRTFIESLPPSSTTVAPPPSEKAESRDASAPLSTVLLTATPDFMLVVSLKGSFLYVAPAVRRVLGYEPEELVGKAITDYCYQHDIVPLTRELKESSATTGITNDLPHATMPRTVDLLFRARTKAGDYVWVECRGRLHVEPGKGRKAIILSGRAMGMATMPWSHIVNGGGLNTSIRNTRAISLPEDEGVEVEVVEAEREFWGSLSKEGVLLVVGRGAKDVLGWTESEMRGRMLATFLENGEEHAMGVLDEELRRMYCEGRINSKRVYTRMRRKDGGNVGVHLVLHQPQPQPQSGRNLGIPRPAVLYQIQVIDHLPSNIQASGTLCHEASGDVFEELQVTRGTSWQYELQQLRFANQTLSDEIGLLEAQRVQAEQQQQQQQQTGRGERNTYDGRANSSYATYGGVKRSWDSRH
ncbi:blue light receptor [Pleurotus pulmonarius]|nr:blue light receptor [Pleurotus pulmonarius]